MAGDLAGATHVLGADGLVALAGATPAARHRPHPAVRRSRQSAAGRAARPGPPHVRHPGRRRGRRRRALVPGDGGRVRQGARAVRPADRRVPGGQAPVRRDARDRRGGHRRGLGRRAARSTTATRRAVRRSPPTSPSAICFDGAVEVAKDCIQVLGGIGFTLEHDAHLYLRRALALRALVGDADAAAAAADRRARSTAYAGACEVDLDGPRRRSPRPRSGTRPSGSPRCPTDERRAALAEAGYLTPHWPAPYGLGADAGQQLVIDEELAAGRRRRGPTS